MIWLMGNWCIFETVTDTNLKHLENSKEVHQVYVGNIGYNISVAEQSPPQKKWRLKVKRLG
jgi:hypothetical protein